MSTLVLLRHGESEWNALILFTGWVDVDLTDKGRAEAARGGELLVEHDVLPDVLFTSLLRRAITTANLALDAADRHWIPVVRDWRLNERHYGALQGLDKAETKAKYGEDQFMAWRRSYDTPPPPIEAGSEFSQDADPRYADIDLRVTVCVATNAYPGEVKERALVALFGDKRHAGFFDPDRFTFGTPLSRAALMAAIQEVPGVKAVERILVRRRGVFAWRAFDEFILRVGPGELVRVANDPMLPERGAVTLHMDGGA